MKLGNLNFEAVEENLDLLGLPVRDAIQQNKLHGSLVAEIDPTVSDTEAFCKKYNIGLDVSVNCVIVEAKRADRVWYAACLVPATVRADINSIVRRELDARKISFAPREKAIELTRMEFSGISPLGLPPEWIILVDAGAAALDHAVVGSGIRKSKLLVSGTLLSSLPHATVMPLTK